MSVTKPVPCLVVDIDCNKPVWYPSKVVCSACGEWWVGVIHKEADPNTLECKKCGGFSGVVTPIVYDG